MKTGVVMRNFVSNVLIKYVDGYLVNKFINKVCVGFIKGKKVNCACSGCDEKQNVYEVVIFTEGTK